MTEIMERCRRASMRASRDLEKAMRRQGLTDMGKTKLFILCEMIGAVEARIYFEEEATSTDYDRDMGRVRETTAEYLAEVRRIIDGSFKSGEIDRMLEKKGL